MIQQLHYGSKKISYYLEFSKRKTLGITVTPDMEVMVKAPEGTSQERIEEKLEKRAPWILKQQNYFLRFYPKKPEKQYRGGESHLYLGRQYRLRVATAKKNEVFFTGREIHVHHNLKSTAKFVLNSWYRYKAKEKFAEIAEPWIHHFEQYGVALDLAAVHRAFRFDVHDILRPALVGWKAMIALRRGAVQSLA